MIRLVFITDFTESFAYCLLRGIIKYSKQTQQWEVCRMPPAFKRKTGMESVVEWAKKWGADVVIGQFDPDDDVSLFKKSGIIAIAQDYKKKFANIPNITADYYKTGKMAAELFLERGFRNFGFFGYKDVCWSDERCAGFRSTVEKAGLGENFHSYTLQEIDELWYYDAKKLQEWITGLPKPIAIMACDDNQGSMLIDACNAAGVCIPSELSLIGVDNDEVICNLSNPTLSSIFVDIERGGYETAIMAEKMIADRDFTGNDIILHPEKIVSRMSTAAYATDDKSILRALQFIHANIERKISVRDILDEVPVSRRLLEIRFKAVTGESIYQYISRARVEHFAELILNSNDAIVDIAYSIGENDSKSISRRFKALKGCTPNEWRMKNYANWG